ncbi:Histidine transporter, periplasmic histidine-binding protein [Pseudomonas cannabina]|uniref:Histidine transporter, periplasmic histidine-binding protein n=1 Tax=Pseudomonas cannabina TaxID=86840 RepID=A0A3M3LEE9_PSECA|nr:Histidine transporter, periplasmic histidine-binding protein [Pseudomonas cannabina]
MLNTTLGEMSAKHRDPKVVAQDFLKQHPEIWKAWLPVDVANKVSAGL